MIATTSVTAFKKQSSHIYSSHQNLPTNPLIDPDTVNNIPAAVCLSSLSGQIGQQVASDQKKSLQETISQDAIV
ncbi:hypothetical protein HI914_05099 [Erysiphe necator]|nr:hypothetical protein HI914_05099 [Erysiphe necator]